MTIYGFREHESGAILSLFHRDGVVLSKSIGPTGRWVIVQYATPDSVLAALSRHGTVLNGTMVGVKKTTIDEVSSSYLETATHLLAQSCVAKNDEEDDQLTLTKGRSKFKQSYKPIGGPYWSRSRWEEKDPDMEVVKRKHSFCSFMMELLQL